MHFHGLLLVFIVSNCFVACKSAEEAGQGQGAVVKMEVKQNHSTKAQQQAHPAVSQAGTPSIQPASQIAEKAASHAQPVDANSKVAAAPNEKLAHVQNSQERKEEVDWGHGIDEGKKDVNVEQVKQHLDQVKQDLQQKQQKLEEQQRQEKHAQQQLQQKQTPPPPPQQQQQPEQQHQDQKQQRQEQQQQHQEQQQQHQEQQQQHQEQQQQQQEQQQQQHTGETQHQEGHVGQHGEDVGVQNPEDVIHGNDVHHDPHEIVEDAAEKEKKQAEMEHQAQLRFQAEQQELQDLQPKVLANVHDSEARKAAEFMKHTQLGPGDLDGDLHGGQHVHDEGQGHRKEILGGDVELAVHGEAGVHDEGEHKDDKVHSSVDPEQLMHAGEGGEHAHNPHLEKQQGPGAEDLPGGTMPKEHFHHSKDKQTAVDMKAIGIDVEKVIHGEGYEHVHEESPDYKPKNKVRYQDIIDLGLDQELLKGIDLSKLLEQEKKEMEDWNKQKREDGGADSNGAAQGKDGERNAWFWQKQVNDLRKQYMQKLYAKVRHIENPDLDKAEWEIEDGQARDFSEPHEGESMAEHQLEEVGSTLAKGDRLPYKVMQERRAKNEEEGTTQEPASEKDGQMLPPVQSNEGSQEAGGGDQEEKKR